MRETRARGSSSSSIAIRPDVRVHIVPVSSSRAIPGVVGIGSASYRTLLHEGGYPGSGVGVVADGLACESWALHGIRHITGSRYIQY